MATEIERKFLVNLNLLSPEIDKLDPDHCRSKIKQGYLVTRPGFSLRVRTTRAGDSEHSYLQIKTGIGINHKEYSAQIYSYEEADELFQECIYPPISKTRWTIGYYVGSDDSDDITYEVDFFDGDNEGLVLAEIELYKEDQEFYKPDWLGKEVTDDPRYYNVNLAHHPYKYWR